MDWIRIIRPLTGVFAAAIIFASWFDAGLILGDMVYILMCVGFLAMSATMATNDYFDREVDRQKRPFVSLHTRSVLRFARLLWLFVVIGSVFVYQFDVNVAALVWIQTVLGASYVCVRPVFLLNNLVVALSTASLMLYPMLSGSGQSAKIFPGFSLIFLVIWAREIIKDIEDVVYDVGSKKTIPIFFNEPFAERVTRVLYWVGVHTFFASSFVSMDPGFFVVGMGLSSFANYTIFLGRNVKKRDIDLSLAALVVALLV